MKIQKLIGLFTLLAFMVSITTIDAQRSQYQNRRSAVSPNAYSSQHTGASPSSQATKRAVVKTKNGYQLNGLKMSEKDQKALLSLLAKSGQKSHSLVVNNSKGLRTYGKLSPKSVTLVNKTRNAAEKAARPGGRTWSIIRHFIIHNDTWGDGGVSVSTQQAIYSIMQPYLNTTIPIVLVKKSVL